MTDQPELLPCPFCGGGSEFEHPAIEAVVRCRSCGSSVTESVNPTIIARPSKARELEAKRVVTKWNTRPAPAVAVKPDMPDIFIDQWQKIIDWCGENNEAIEAQTAWAEVLSALSPQPSLTVEQAARVLQEFIFAEYCGDRPKEKCDAENICPEWAWRRVNAIAGGQGHE